MKKLFLIPLTVLAHICMGCYSDDNDNPPTTKVVETSSTHDTVADENGKYDNTFTAKVKTDATFPIVGHVLFTIEDHDFIESDKDTILYHPEDLFEFTSELESDYPLTADHLVKAVFIRKVN